MIKLPQFSLPTLSFLVPGVLILFLIAFSQSVWFALHPEPLSIGITVDLVLIIPGIYFLFIRKQNIPKITVVPIYIIGLIIATWIIPTPYQTLLDHIKTGVLPLVELGVMSFMVWKVRKIYLSYQRNKVGSFDFYTALKKASLEVLPRQVHLIFAIEIATFYYGLLDWKKRTLKSGEFSYHKNNGIIAVFTAIIFLVVVETFVLHLLIAPWNITVAWIISGLSIYTGFQLLGMMRSMIKRPIIIENTRLLLRFGIMAEAVIPFSIIDRIELTSTDIENTTIKKLSPLTDLSGGHNVLLHLNSEHTFHGFYGKKCKTKCIAFYVDDKELFAGELKALL